MHRELPGQPVDPDHDHIAGSSKEENGGKEHQHVPGNPADPRTENSGSSTQGAIAAVQQKGEQKKQDKDEGHRGLTVESRVRHLDPFRPEHFGIGRIVQFRRGTVWVDWALAGDGDLDDCFDTKLKLAEI